MKLRIAYENDGVGEHIDVDEITKVTAIAPLKPDPMPDPKPDPQPEPADFHAAFEVTGVLRIGNAVHVSSVGHATFAKPEDAIGVRYQWDFGDAEARDFNQTPGFNAAHIYHQPGDYTITLTLTGQGGQTSVARQTITIRDDMRKIVQIGVDEPLPEFAPNTIYQLQRGGRWSIDAYIDIPTNTAIEAYGEGDRPTIHYRPARPKEDVTQQPMLRVWRGARGTSVRGLRLVGAPIDANINEQTIPYNRPEAFQPHGVDVTLVDVEFHQVHRAITCGGGLVRLHVQDCVVPTLTSMHHYFCWGEGEQIVMLNNHVMNSVASHTIRTTQGISQLLLWRNVFANPNAPLDWRHDRASITMQTAEWCTVAECAVDAAIGMGPLTYDSHRDQRARFMIIEDCSTARIDVNHGSEHIMIRGNTIRVDSFTCIRLSGWDALLQRGLKDVRIEHNALDLLGDSGSLLHLFSPAQDDHSPQIDLVGNDYRAPNATGVPNEPSQFAAGADLRSLRRIDGNVYRTRAKTFARVGETPIDKADWLALGAVNETLMHPGHGVEDALHFVGGER